MLMSDEKKLYFYNYYESSNTTNFQNNGFIYTKTLPLAVNNLEKHFGIEKLQHRSWKKISDDEYQLKYNRNNPTNRYISCYVCRATEEQIIFNKEKLPYPIREK